MFELALTVGIVVFTSATCSLFEAVLYSVPLSHIESLVQSGRPSGRLLRAFRERVDRPISAILSLNTIANTGGAAVAGALASRELFGVTLAAFPIGFTLVILFLSEILPKTAGVVYCRALVGLIAAPLQLLVWVFLPFIWLSRLVTRMIAKSDQDAGQISAEELSMMARLGMRSGHIKEDRGLAIQNILSLGSKTAHDVMTPRTVVFALKSSQTVAEAREYKELFAYSRIPIFDDDLDDVVGVVHRREILATIADDKFDVQLERLLKPVSFVIESIALDRLLELFLEQRQHLFVVLDEFGGLSGVVTLEDVVEEILGKEIVDEFDEVTDTRELARQRRELAIREQGRRSGPRTEGRE